jgi:2,4-dienoyl-CoA reductase-like NADH-dependent reductase (Old Yellow Enzyme family)
MPELFDPLSIGSVTIPNRFMRSATWDSSATDSGEVTDDSLRIIGGLAKGGVGLIVTGHAYVTDEGKAAIRQYGVSHDRHVAGMRRLAQAAHDHGARIAVQIAHGGLSLAHLVKKEVVGLAPSLIEGHPWPHRAMTGDEVQATVDAFAAAAARVKEAGFDAVQLHGAHGHLMDQFLSPLMNKRTDEWGGSPDNRRRFYVETVKAVRRAVGPDYPVIIKMGLRDRTQGGLTLEEGLATLKAIAEAGLDAVEVSAGFGSRAAVERPDAPEHIYYREDAVAARRAVDIPIMLVGGIRRFETAQEIISSGDVDMVSLARPLIREDDLIARWRSGDRAPATCISCNKCFSFGVRGEVLDCGEECRLREEAAASSARSSGPDA